MARSSAFGFDRIISTGRHCLAKVLGPTNYSRRIITPATSTRSPLRAKRHIQSHSLFTNVWLNSSDGDSDNKFPAIGGGGGIPGDYLSGGAASNVLNIWQKFAQASSTVRHCGGYEIKIERCFVFRTSGPGSGMVIHRGGGVFLRLGWGFRVSAQSRRLPASFASKKKSSPTRRQESCGQIGCLTVTRLETVYVL
ncbi:hypothetical protein CONLIGDRAFT_704814 [Coniochaeta ligniaria NRRL 30616]|uniref:DUF5597 domain-containing protein n=1 Tax=Coniochaeta ligniaria NRRL 30616 TaxID=1408157 RepID=A0A1J7IX19_9PEZI|nr:hypothetical protein CONLIGDRAFT_704814 [Coniochaeta ligniaria NRRL 30616]